MIITIEGLSKIETYIKRWNNDRFDFYYQGVIYIGGSKVGEESIEKFANLICNYGITKAVLELRGNYFVYFTDKEQNVSYAFIDNSGCFDVFYNKKAISTSFLDLVELCNYTVKDINRERIIEFCNLGNIHLGETFIDECKKIHCNQIITISNEGIKDSLTKNLVEIQYEKSETDFMKFFEELSFAIKDYNISMDLTGGIDSRLVAVILDYFSVKFETACSGRDGIGDLEISKAVSKILKHDSHITYHDISTLEQDLDSLFILCDGMSNIFRHHRLMQNNKNRVDRGKNLAIGGVGGELYKDYGWLQDFPFYSLKKSNINKIFKLRLLPVACKNDYFTSEYKRINNNFEKLFKEKLSAFVLSRNTETYDNIQYNVEMRTFGSRNISINNKIIDFYGPLLELDLVRFAFHLKRRKRFFNNFHRDTITKLNPIVAKYPTTEGGMSVSSNPFYMINDLRLYTINGSKRLIRKVKQVFFNKAHFEPNANNEDFDNKIRELQISEEAVKALKKEGILNEEITIQQINNNHLGNLISLYLFIKFISNAESEE